MAKAEESKEPDEQRQKTLVFDAEIPVSPLAEKRGDCGEERRGEKRIEEKEEKRGLSVYTPRQQPNSPRSGRIIK